MTWPLTPVAVVTSSTSLTVSDFVPVSLASSSVTLTLPSGAANQSQVGVKLVVPENGRLVIIACASGDTFNVQTGGPTDIYLSSLNQAVLLQYDSSIHVWYVLTTDALAPTSQQAHFYVLPAVGNDTNPGTSWDRALATLTKALTLAQATSGAVIHIGPGTLTMPTGQTAIGMSNVLIDGTPGATTLLWGSGTTGNGIAAGFDSYTSAGNYYTDVHFRNLRLDLSAVTASQTGGLVVGAVQRYSVINCFIIGPSFPLDVGADLLPSMYGLVQGCVLEVPSGANAPQAFAPTNVIGCDFLENTLVILAGEGGAIDAEPNQPTDSLLGLSIKGNHVYGNGVGGGVIIQPGGATDPNRLRGVEVTGNVFYDAAGVSVKTPDAIVEGNRWIWSSPYTYSFVPSGMVSLAAGGGADGAWSGADRASVKNNKGFNMSADGQYPAIWLTDVSDCDIADNDVIDENVPPNTSFAIQETQTVASIASGFAPQPPSGMTITLSEGLVQAANAGTITYHAAQTVTIPAASSYPRVDLVAINTSTGAASVVEGTQSPFPSINSACGYPAAGSVAALQISVPAGASSITQADILDVRRFTPSNNQVKQRPPIASVYGTTALLPGNGSRRVRLAHGTLNVYDAYTQAVLSTTGLVGFWPLRDLSGRVAIDLSDNDNPGAYTGGVLLNRQIGSTSRYGAHFDTTGFVLITQIPELILTGPFTLEAEVLADNASGFYEILAQGFGATDSNFLWRLEGSADPPAGSQGFQFGNSASLQSNTALSLTSLNHVAIDWSGTTLAFYLNGTANGSSTPGTVTFNLQANYPIGIGATFAGNEYAVPSFEGFIRNVAMYSPNIGGATIAAHYALM